MKKFNKNKIITEGNIVNVKNYLDTLNKKVTERLSKKDVALLDILFENFVGNFPLEDLGNNDKIKELKKLEEQIMPFLNKEQQDLLNEWSDLENECVFDIIKQAVFYGFYANILLGNQFIIL